MPSKFKRAILSLFVPIILFVVTACPGLIIDNIQVTFGPGGAIVGATGTFSCFSPISNDIVTYRWFFGDGATAEGKSVTHSYNSAGEFLVECHVVTIDSVLIFSETITIELLPLIIDPFTDNQNVNDIVCGVIPRGVSQTITGETEFNERNWRSISFDSGTGTLTLTTNGGSGFLTISVASGNCDLSASLPKNHLSWDEGSSGGPNLTAAGFSTFKLPIASVSGTVTNCRLYTQEPVGGATASTSFTPVAGNVVELSLVGLGALNAIALDDCNFIDGAQLVLGPPFVD